MSRKYSNEKFIVFVVIVLIVTGVASEFAVILTCGTLPYLDMLCKEIAYFHAVPYKYMR